MSSKNNGIWILGRNVPGMNCIDWFIEKLPSFADCNTLVVDMSSITEKTLANISNERVEQFFQEINKRFKSGGRIVCILQKHFEALTKNGHRVDNYFWSPVSVPCTDIPIGHGIPPLDNLTFEEYVKKITEWNLKIDPLPTIKTRNWGTSGGSTELDELIINKNREILGGSFHYDLGGNRYTGKIHFLPPLQDSETGMNTILEILNVKTKTPPPEWSESIKLPGTNEIEKSIQEIDGKISQLYKDKLNQERQKKSLENHKKLLYETGDELEFAIVDALTVLGISNARRGEPGKDDVLFDFTTTDFKICSMEAKGVKNGVSLDDFRQLDNWVTDHLSVGIKAKGVLFANTYRLQNPSESESKRMDFNNKTFEDYYQPRNQCILPTLTLFKLVEHKLKGNELDPKKIEEVIANSSNVLKFDDFV